MDKAYTNCRFTTWAFLILDLFLCRLSQLPLLLPSHFSRVRLCAAPETAAHQAPLSLGFCGQEHWSGSPFPSPMHESEVAQSCPIPSGPMDCSLPGSSVHGIFQARVLERGAIEMATYIYVCVYIYIYIRNRDGLLIPSRFFFNSVISRTYRIILHPRILLLFSPYRT